MMNPPMAHMPQMEERERENVSDDPYLCDHTTSAHPETLHSRFFNFTAGIALAVSSSL